MEFKITALSIKKNICERFIVADLLMSIVYRIVLDVRAMIQKAYSQGEVHCC